MKRFFVYIVTCLFSLAIFFNTQNAFAIVKFNTSFQNYYRVNPDGSTHVSFIINQKNNLSVVYATDFGLNINETKISNVKVTDEGIIVIPDIVKTLNQTTISFTFANKVVGKDKNHQFIIEYDTTDIAIKHGNTWQINIPRLESDENVTDQLVVLTVPENFPVPAYIDPKPDTVNKNIYYFSGSKLGNKTISAVFGQTQYYQGKISYHLQNDSKLKVNTEIALPPDTAYQTVFYKNIDPKPNKITVDDDGNYLGSYTLEPNQKIEVILSIFFKLNFTPKTSSFPPSKNYLLSNNIWNYDNGIFDTKETKNLVSAKNIYDFVVDKLKYDYEKVNRQKSLKTSAGESLINSQSAICTDFTNVFVSLARKAGIYSRELQGYAISENPDLRPISTTQDVLHAWPEYYDTSTNKWIQVDPTWSNTTRGVDYFNKLDFNHLVFVVHGNNPNYPIPAGGYKSTTDKSKDINIESTEAVTFPEPDFQIQLLEQDLDTLIFTIKNGQGVSFSGNSIVSGNAYLKESEQIINVPPYGETELKVKLQKRPILGKVNSLVIININGNHFEQPVSIKPTINTTFIYAGLFIVLGIIAYVSRNIYLRRQKQKTTIYR